MLETDFPDLSWRVVLRESTRRREEALDEVRERIAGFMAIGLVAAVPLFGIVSGHEFSLVEETEAAEPVSDASILEPPSFNFEAVARRIQTNELSPSEVRDVQTRLKSKGFDPGPIDGVFGKRTLSALNAYRQSLHLSPAPVVSREAASVLLDK